MNLVDFGILESEFGTSSSFDKDRILIFWFFFHIDLKVKSFKDKSYF